MKKLFVLFGLLCSLLLTAQDQGGKNDIIVTKEGELIQAKVVKVTENAISFNYPGEAVINEVATTKLQKIVFSSGRTQLFGKGGNTERGQQLTQESNPLPQEEIYTGSGSEYTSGPGYAENELTVLPLSYIKNGVHDKNLSNQMTTFVTSFMASNAKPYGINVPNMDTTIEKLVDADIGYQKLTEATPTELRDVLGSEFILRAKLTDDTSSNSRRDLYSEGTNSDFKTGIKIVLELYCAKNDDEKYNINFSEDISLRDNSTHLEGKWKSSIKYVLQQLLSSKSL